MAYLDNFNYQIVGPEGSPYLVLLHGLMGSGANWRKVTSSLQDDYRILLYDQRGHGRSFQPASGYRPEDYADDLHLILQELGWSQVFLVGHSMGGRNALNFAARFPDMVHKLVIEDIGPDASERAIARMIQLIESVPTPFGSRQEAKKFLRGDFLEMFKDRQNIDSISLYFYSNVMELADGTVDWRFSKPAILESVRMGRARERWDEVRHLRMPTLLLRGSHSEELSRAVYERMLAENPRIHGLEIPESGHWVHADQPEAFVRALREFLQSPVHLAH